MNQNIIEKFNDLLGEEKVRVDEPMKRHTTFRIGGPADYFLLPSSEEEQSGILKICKNEELPYFILIHRFHSSIFLYLFIMICYVSFDVFILSNFPISSCSVR